MELDISAVFASIEPHKFSASQMELGPEAGRITWENAKQGPMLLDTPEKREAFDSWAADFGAWTVEELAAHTPEEANALLLQFISGDMREGDIGPDSTPEEWAAYEEAQQAGRVASYIFRAEDGRIYYTLDR